MPSEMECALAECVKVLEQRPDAQRSKRHKCAIGMGRAALASLPDRTGEPVAWREIDLSKAVKSDHPDIVPGGKQYLVKVYGGWFFGQFTRQWYGLSFSNWGTSGCQFDAPGYNSSRWERVIEIDPEALATPPDAEQARVAEQCDEWPTCACGRGGPDYCGLAAEARLAQQAERATAVTEAQIDRFYESLQSQPSGSAYPPRQHVRIALQAALAEPQQAVTEIGDWTINTSTGTDILMFKQCSVIENEQAHFVLGLIEAALRTSSTGGKG